jgi:voltage-gated potassium channel
MYSRIKNRTYQILQITAEDTHSKIFSVFIITLIIFNVLAVIFGTVESFAEKYEDFLINFEIISVVIFSIEYVLRIWSSTTNTKYKKPILGRFKFALTPLAIVDFLAIIPFYLPPFNMLDLRIVRALRLFRLLRLLRIKRFAEPLKLFANVFKNKKDELLIALITILILALGASVIMYFVEHNAQPIGFASIPDAMWWAVITMTTVGYGDIYPITVMGKIFGSFISILGLGLFALPTAIISAGLLEELQAQKKPNGAVKEKRDQEN